MLLWGGHPTGQDLRAALRRAVSLVALLVMMILAAPRVSLAQNSSHGIDAARLDQAIDQVIHRREFTWRMPRAEGEAPRGAEPGWLHSALDMIDRAWEWVIDAIRAWLRPKPGVEGATKEGPVTPRMLKLLIGLVAVLLAGAAVFWFRRRKPEVVHATPVATVAVDLADESLTADQLPESSWMKLADEWLVKGDCRMALRALYLAGLKYLGERGLVSIQRWKSGLDYRRELERRARSNPQVAPVFARNLGAFERGWYGRHPVDRGMVESFAERLKEIRSSLG